MVRNLNRKTTKAWNHRAEEKNMYIGNVHPSEFYKDKPEVLNRFNDFMKKEGIEY